MYIIHIETESTENYYFISKNKPTDKQVDDKMLQVLVDEGFEEEEIAGYFTDLASATVVKAKEL